MKRPFRALFLSAVLLLGPRAESTVNITLRQGFDLNWYYHNDSSTYKRISYSTGYYRDYDGDGLADFLVILENLASGDWRIFTLNTAPTGGEKTYAADRTAGRDIASQPGTFVPRSLYFPFEPSMDSPDLVLVGTNAAADSLDFSRFIFWRLDKTDPAFPTQKSWTIDGVTSRSTILWPSVSWNSDRYPDFLVYDSAPNADGRFRVACYDGLDGSLIWARTLDLDPDDSGTGIDFFVAHYATPLLNVVVLPEGSSAWGNGDFDGDGKPEILLFYSFGYGDVLSTYGIKADITMLNSAGGFLAPYTSAWTRVFEAESAINPPVPYVRTDYDKDGFADMMILNPAVTSTPPPAVFEGYSLKKRASLFNSVAADFGNPPNDLSSFGVLDVMTYADMAPADINGDGWSDLCVFRYTALPTDFPLRVGVFNAYAGNGSAKGRLMWAHLDQFDDFDRTFWCGTDFDGDNINDLVLARDPDAPDDPVAGHVTWHVADLALSATTSTVVKEFDYSPSHSFSWNAATDDFLAGSLMFFTFGDVDGDGQRDTAGSVNCAVDTGDDGTIEMSYGFLFVYDNTPGANPPDITAEMELRVEGEDWIPYLYPTSAFLLPDGGAVDNNQDGFSNDIVLEGENAVVALSFQYKVAPPPPAQVSSPNPPDGGELPTDGVLKWEPARNATSYDVYLGTSQSAVDAATTASAEYQGNQPGTTFVPPAPFDPGRTYFWRVDACNMSGVTKGAVWSFRAVWRRTRAAWWRFYR